MHPRTRKLLLTTTALLALARLALTPVAAGPAGGTVVGGSATIQGAGTSNVTITQTSPSAIINWTTFNIGVGQTTTFNQPSSSSVVLNRVTGGLGPSEILGTLTANGRVFIINRDGILFGPGAVVNTAGFVATTHDIKNQDFMAGRYNFNIPGRPDASIVNQGTITATSGGFAALVAPGVRNSGTITATLGTVALGAANGFTLDLYGDRLITLAVNDQIAASVKDVATGKPLKSLITNDGKIRANGGRVELTAAAARTVVDSVINTSGVIKANSIGTRNGMIVLSAGTAATKPAGAPTQVVRVSGTLSAAGNKKGTKGGTIVVTGEDIKVAGAKIDASGRAGGGKVLIGGDWGGGKPDTSLVSNQSAKLEGFAIPTATTVSVDAATTINASARDRGDGGKVVLWSDSQTTFAGTILARGGESGGNGGFVETSGKQRLAFTGTVDTRAPNGAAGTLLLDPYDVTISNSPTISPSTFPPGGTWEPTDNGSNINVIDLQNQLALGNVIVTTTGSGTELGNITVSAAVNWTSAYTLTLQANNEIFINAAITASAGGLTLNAGGNITTAFASGSVNVARFTLQNGTWNQVIPSPYLPTFVAQDFRITGGTFIRANSGDGLAPATAYQITDVYGLQGMGSAGMTSKHFKLVNNIDASVTVGWNGGAGFVPIGPIGMGGFTGTLDGQNFTINALRVAPTVTNITEVGMFGLIRGVGPGTGMVSNLNLTNAVVIADPNIPPPGQFVGVLAGQNAGTITNVSVSGTLNGGTMQGVLAGGLVGQNGTFGPGGQFGTITASSANVAVTVGDSCPSFNCGIGMNAAGGLVGFNAPGSTITNSFAFGAVTAGNFSTAGGLVGLNFGAIAGTSVPTVATICGAGQSCATGNVQVGSNGQGGGLTGANSGTIVNSFATGNVTGGPGTSNLTTNQDNPTNIGGLSGNNQGQIANSHARGNVGSLNVSNLSAGGLVGDNSGAIFSSFAVGNVAAGTSGGAGGLVGSNSQLENFNCVGCLMGDGAGSFNAALIANSFASGNVTVGSQGIAGGLAAGGDGTFFNAQASGNVSGGDNSVLGGFIAVLGIDGQIAQSSATGTVTSTGPHSVVGGFVGITGGRIGLSTASGAVTVTGNSESFLGGFAGVNLGLISQSATSSPVSGPGNHDIIGGFVAANFGSINNSTSSGNATGGSNSVVGGFAGVDASFINFPSGFIPGTFPTGTITNSSATGTASGGSGSTVGPFIAVSNPTSSSVPSYPSIVDTCGDPLCVILRAGRFGGNSNRAGFATAAAADHPKSRRQHAVRRPQHRPGRHHHPAPATAAGVAAARTGADQPLSAAGVQ